MKFDVGLLENFTKVVTAASIILLGFGYLDHTFYYAMFGISITDYIGVSEILLSSIGNFLFTITVMIVPLVGLAFFLTQIMDAKNKNIIWYKNKPFAIFVTFFLIIFIVLKVGKYFHYIQPQDIYTTDVFTQMLGLMLIYIPGATLFFKLLHDNIARVTNRPTTVIFYSILLITLFLETLALNRSKYDEVMSNNSRKVEITFNDNTIITTNDSVKYVGKTESYYIFTNKNSKMTTVYRSSDVKKTSILKPTVE